MEPLAIFSTAPEKHRISSLVARMMATAKAVSDRAKVRSAGAQMKNSPITTSTNKPFLMLDRMRRRWSMSPSNLDSRNRPATMRSAIAARIKISEPTDSLPASLSMSG
jgi:hypothetical protein